VAAAFTGIFLDNVAEAVEEKHYPGLSSVGTVPVLDTLRDSLSLIAVTVAVNIVALILMCEVVNGLGEWEKAKTQDKDGESDAVNARYL